MEKADSDLLHQLFAENNLLRNKNHSLIREVLLLLNVSDHVFSIFCVSCSWHCANATLCISLAHIIFTFQALILQFFCGTLKSLLIMEVVQ
jgi:hypothetical protein